MAGPDAPEAVGGLDGGLGVVGHQAGQAKEARYPDEVVDIPFSGATSWKWEEEAIKEVADKMGKKVRRLLNGRRVTVWRICVEKRRKYFADVFGLASGQLAVLPPDCRQKILDYLPHGPAGADNTFSCAELDKKAQETRDAAAKKWASIITSNLLEKFSAKGNMILGTIIPLGMVTSEEAGSTWPVAAACLRQENGGYEPDASGKRPMLQNCWWSLPELHRELRALGFEPEVIEGPNMLNGATEKTAKAARLKNPYVLKLMSKQRQ